MSSHLKLLSMGDVNLHIQEELFDYLPQVSCNLPYL